MELLHANPWKSAWHIVNNSTNVIMSDNIILIFIYCSEPEGHRPKGTESTPTVRWVLEHQQGKIIDIPKPPLSFMAGDIRMVGTVTIRKPVPL